MRPALLLLALVAPLAAQNILENYACVIPESVSKASPAIVTCPASSPHGYIRKAYNEWNFTALPSDGGTINAGGTTYTFVASLNNANANEVLIGSTTNVTAINLFHAVNDDGVGEGTLYSSATTRNSLWDAMLYQNTDDIVSFFYRFPDASGTGQGISFTSTNAGGAWLTTTSWIFWYVNIRGAQGDWAALGTGGTPILRIAKYVSPTTFALYTTGRSAVSTTGYASAYDKTTQPNIQMLQSSPGGQEYPQPYGAESWSQYLKVVPDPGTGEPVAKMTVPGCDNTAHELECSMGFRNPEPINYLGVVQTLSSFVISSGVATLTFSSAFPYTAGNTTNIQVGSLIWPRHIEDAQPGSPWTYTQSLTNHANGTELNKLVRYVPGANTVEKMPTTAGGPRGGAIGICTAGCGTSGTATVATAGQMDCNFDNATTAGHWVTVSGYDNRCHDAGAAFPRYLQPIGIVQDTGAAGVHTIWWNGLNRAFTVQSVNGPGDGTSVTQITINVPGYPDGSRTYSRLASYTGKASAAAMAVGSNNAISPYAFMIKTDPTNDPKGRLVSFFRDQSVDPSTVNRINFRVKFGKNNKACGMEIANSIGAFTLPPGAANPSGKYYHYFDTAEYNGRWATFTWTQEGPHQEGISQDLTFDYPYNPTLTGNPYGWFTPPTANPLAPMNYFERLVYWYLDMLSIGCVSLRPGGGAAGQDIFFGPMTYATVANEPEELVSTRVGVYSSARFQPADTAYTPTGTGGYELSFAGPLATTGVTYEFRYSTTGSLKSEGWSTGKCQDGTTTCGSSDRVTNTISPVNYQSATMSEEPVIYWGIYPTAVPVKAVSPNGSNPAWIFPNVSLGLSVGDHVTATGTTANVTNSAVSFVREWQTWNLARGTLVSITPTAGTCEVALSVPHSLVAGWPILVFGSNNATLTPGVAGGGGSGATLYKVSSVGDATHFSFSCPGVSGAIANTTVPASVLGVMAWVGYAVPATASGTYTTGGFIRSTEEYKNFAEVILTADGSYVPPPFTITTASLPGGTTGLAYSQSISTANGTGTVSCSLAAGSLPAGLTLNSDCTITGTPTGSGATANFTILAADSAMQEASQALSIEITDAPDPCTITTLPLPNTHVGAAVTIVMTSTGCVGATWSISAGSLPDGLSITSSSGTISGIPTTAGSYTFTVQAAAGSTGNKGFFLVVNEGARTGPVAGSVTVGGSGVVK